MLLLPSPHLNHEVSNNFWFSFFPSFFFFLFLDKNFEKNKKKRKKILIKEEKWSLGWCQN